MFSKAANLLKSANRVTAFTGAGISVESGIPPFRGETGLWHKYDPIFLDINYFMTHPQDSWRLIKKIFYDFFGQASPNAAHYALAKMENSGVLQAIITQNIDNLHQKAGSQIVHEFHGTSKILRCITCNRSYPVSEINLDPLPPKCPYCKGLLKPDFIFFGEAIPEPACTNSFNEAAQSDVFILVGTTGEIMPASTIPFLAHDRGKKIIEVNIEKSNFTNQITDIFLQGKATTVLSKLAAVLT